MAAGPVDQPSTDDGRALVVPIRPLAREAHQLTVAAAGLIILFARAGNHDTVTTCYRWFMDFEETSSAVSFADWPKGGLGAGQRTGAGER